MNERKTVERIRQIMIELNLEDAQRHFTVAEISVDGVEEEGEEIERLLYVVEFQWRCTINTLIDGERLRIALRFLDLDDDEVEIETKKPMQPPDDGMIDLLQILYRFMIGSLSQLKLDAHRLGIAWKEQHWWYGLLLKASPRGQSIGYHLNDVINNPMLDGSLLPQHKVAIFVVLKMLQLKRDI